MHGQEKPPAGHPSDVEPRVRDAERGGGLLACRVAQLLAALLFSIGRLADAESCCDFGLRWPKRFIPYARGRRPSDLGANNLMRNQIVIFSAVRHVLLVGIAIRTRPFGPSFLDLSLRTRRNSPFL